jgi:hypothetical protein
VTDEDRFSGFGEGEATHDELEARRARHAELVRRARIEVARMADEDGENDDLAMLRRIERRRRQPFYDAGFTDEQIEKYDREDADATATMIASHGLSWWAIPFLLIPVSVTGIAVVVLLIVGWLR